MRKKVNIIGAGISGLSLGCYLQMNGFDTEIFEMHNLPGGLCTGWKRGDYKFDACIHWLVGSSKEDNFYKFWNELVDMKKINFVYHEKYSRVYGTNKNYIDIFNDIDKLENELLLKAPEDKALILSLTKSVRKFLSFNIDAEKAFEVAGIFDKIKTLAGFLPYMTEFNKWMKLSSKEFASKCKNPLLKNVFENFFDPNMAMIFVVFCLAWFSKKAAGYPIGGSLNFAENIEKRYLELGGKINYKSKVEKINIEQLSKNYKAVGITLSDDTAKTADITISAADGFYSIYKMLEGRFTSKNINKRYNNALTFPSYIQVSLGVSRIFDNEVQIQSFYTDSSIFIDDQTIAEQLGIHIYNYDRSFAPEGKTVITSIIPTYNFDYWSKLKNTNIEKYKSEKHRISNEVINAIDKHLGNVVEFVEVVDVSTPATVIRYTNNWKGSFEGWILTKNAGFTSYERELPGLENFYMCGQWIQPGGGLPGVLQSARDLAQIICKREKIEFKTFSF